MKTPVLSHAFVSALVSALVFALAWLVACSPASIAAPDAGTSASASDGGPSAGAVEQVCKDVAYARCKQLAMCSATQIEIIYGDIGTCENLFRSTCLVSLSAPGSSSSIAQEQACIAAIPGWACSDIIYGENTPPDCAASHGSLADGATCAANAQCQSTWCSRPVGSSCGTCGPPPAPGDPCKFPSQCGTGLTCSDQTGTCAMHAPLGASCTSAPCNDRLTCAAGICQATAETYGAACSTSIGCDTYAGLSCNGASGTCKTLTIATSGQACNLVEDQYQACLAGNCVRGTCVGNAPLGSACDLVAGPSCMSSTTCVVTSDGGTAGTCQIPGTGCY